jgi:hypothetical protein
MVTCVTSAMKEDRKRNEMQRFATFFSVVGASVEPH